ncbi:MAG: helix-turn-helix domain-containing protein, partial [Anaerolineae bacterium]|nr:helix-turn-helix domain-containing protein [Anaerolineae bacterium]
MPSKSPSYPERNYAFGQMMLTLRSKIGLTQTALADYLGVSRRSVGEWEAGGSYPKVENLKQFITLAIQHRAFPSGHEVEEIHELWKSSHQKVLLNENWLAALLVNVNEPTLSLAASPLPTESIEVKTPLTPVDPVIVGPRIDWGEAVAPPHFYGREWELLSLTEWVIQDRCRVVSILGLGGIGKSSLAVNLMQNVAEHFDVVIWRSLRDAPT